MPAIVIYSKSATMLSRPVLSKFARFALLVCVLLWPRTGFADQQIRADFDGDGQLDRAQMQPSGVVVWLSKARVFSALRGSGHPLQLAAVDIDRDGRPELVTLDAATGLHVWKAHKSGKLRPYRQRPASPGPTVYASKTVGDNPDGIELREPTTLRESLSPIMSTRDAVDTRTTRPVPPRPDRDPRTGCSRFTAPRAPPTPTI
jgi:hypothetical protein